MYRALGLFARVPYIVSCSRPICLASSQLARNFYDTLGVTPNATQSDIKKAYYKLSMQYHPDKNEGSEQAILKFREITEAYEILGSYKSRKMYDRGMIQKSFSNQQQYGGAVADDEEEDDPQTKFYKQHMNRTKAPPPTGSTPIYDFDEWSRAHYGETFDRRRTAKKRYEQMKDVDGRKAVRTLEISVLVMCGFVSLMVLASHYDREEYDRVDTPPPPPSKKID